MEKCLQTVLAAEAIKIKDNFEVSKSPSHTTEADENPTQSAGHTRKALQPLLVAKILPSLAAVVASIFDKESAALVALSNQPELANLSSAVLNETLHTMNKPW